MKGYLQDGAYMKRNETKHPGASKRTQCLTARAHQKRLFSQ